MCITQLFSKRIFFFATLGAMALSVMGGCGKVLNSSSNDAALSSGSEIFVAAKQVMVDNCFSCHSNWSNYSEDQYVTNGLVTRASPIDSILYTRMKGNNTDQVGDMPQRKPAVLQSELNAIESWINSL